MKSAIYVRVSTKGQSTDRQVAELQRVCGSDAEIFREVASGGKGRSDRPVFDELMRRVTQRTIKRVCVWSVDRLGRSLTDLLETLETLRASGASLYIHSQAIDTETPAGKMMFSLLGVFSEFERSIIRARVQSGVDNARANGKRLGRPPVAFKTSERVKALRSEGLSQVTIARKVGLSQAKVSQILKPEPKWAADARKRLEAKGRPAEDLLKV